MLMLVTSRNLRFWSPRCVCLSASMFVCLWTMYRPHRWSSVTLMYDVTFWRYVISKETYHFFTSKIVSFRQMLLKMYTHLAWTYTMYLAKKCIDQNNVTCVSMATKIFIIKCGEFSVTSQNIFFGIFFL